MNDFIEQIIKCSVFIALIIAIILTGVGIVLILFPQVLSAALRYVFAAACLAGGVGLVGAISVGLVGAKMISVSEKKQRNEAH